MRRLLLSAAVILGGAGFGVLALQPTAPAAEAVAAATPAAAPLGDLSALAVIVGDTRTIAATGAFPAAASRITDFETAWDKAASAMRPMDTAAWGNVDAAADAALEALRAGTPDAGTVTATLAGLSTEIAHPTTGAGSAVAPAAITVAADGTVATTGADGRPIPCEDMARAVRTAKAASTPADPAVDGLEAKGLERCNADDDARADGFFAQALTLLAAKP